MFDWVLNMLVSSVKNKETNYTKNLKICGALLRMRFNCLKATEPLWGDSLLFTAQSPEVHNTHLINLDGMKDWK